LDGKTFAERFDDYRVRADENDEQRKILFEETIHLAEEIVDRIRAMQDNLSRASGFRFVCDPAFSDLTEKRAYCQALSDQCASIREAAYPRTEWREIRRVAGGLDEDHYLLRGKRVLSGSDKYWEYLVPCWFIDLPLDEAKSKLEELIFEAEQEAYDEQASWRGNREEYEQGLFERLKAKYGQPSAATVA
jgi:hypothetical protein